MECNLNDTEHVCFAPDYSPKPACAPSSMPPCRLMYSRVMTAFARGATTDCGSA